MVVRTSRLILRPLTLREMAEKPVKEVYLGYKVAPGLMDRAFHSAWDVKICKMEQVPKDDHLYYTYWMLVYEDTVVGLAGFKGFGCDPEAIEIGYGIAPSFSRRGFMTEAVSALCAWALDQRRVMEVTACHVLKSNNASQRVLEKSGFVLTDEGPLETFWSFSRAVKSD